MASRNRWLAALWIGTVVVPTTEMGVLATGHGIGDAVIGASAAALIATEVTIRLLGRGGGQPPMTDLAQA